jgi:hypothetical protein
MGIIYIVSAFVLLRCVFSPSYRSETTARWRKTPTHRVMYEVGGGILGLIILGVIVYLVVANWR